MKPSGAPVRIGMIGAGHIAGYHLQGLLAAGGVDLRWIAGSTRKPAAALAAKHGVAGVATHWRQVIADTGIDAVVIATPDDTHAEIAIAAAQAGKHILLQKPMARTAEECRRILAAVARAGVRLQVSFMHRYFEEVIRAQELLAQGAIGRPYSARMRNATPGADWAAWFYEKARVGGGVVLQLGVHGIDLLRHLFGEIVSLSAHTALLKMQRTLADGAQVRPDGEDHAQAIYRFGSGLLATHEMSLSEVQGCDRFRLEIYGERGTIWLRTSRGPLAMFAPDYTGRSKWIAPELPACEPGARQHRSFLDMVRGTRAQDGTPHDGLAGILVAEAIYRSNASRREETVERTGAQE